jgi:uncharacterized membrane protein YeiB
LYVSQDTTENEHQFDHVYVFRLPGEAQALQQPSARFIRELEALRGTPCLGIARGSIIVGADNATRLNATLGASGQAAAEFDHALWVVSDIFAEKKFVAIVLSDLSSCLLL